MSALNGFPQPDFLIWLAWEPFPAEVKTDGTEGSEGKCLRAYRFLTGNLVLDLSILAWFLAQLIKTVANLVVNRNLDLKNGW